MKRGLLVLLIAVVLGIGATLITRQLCLGTPSSWLCREYGLSSERAAKLEKEYGSRCGPYCGRMCAANARLEQLALGEGLGSGSVTPAIREAVAETDRIRTATRLTMLEHFYAVAAELPPEKRKDYLLKVLPLVIQPCGSR
jgi:hypothetical protein